MKRPRSSKNAPETPSGGEGDHPDRAAGTADAQQLVGDRLMVGSEHRPRRGGHDVEFVVVERQCLRVALDPVQLDTERLRFAAAGGEALGRDVQRDHVGPGLSGADRDVPRSGADVEHALTGGDSAGVDQDRPEAPEELLREPVVVAERPDLPRRVLRLHVTSHLVDACKRRELLKLHEGDATPGSARRLRPDRPFFGRSPDNQDRLGALVFY